MEKTKTTLDTLCYRCAKPAYPLFFQIMDTSTEKRVILCEKCGKSLQKWFKIKKKEHEKI